MQSQNRFFDDVARVASGAVGAITSVRGEIEARIRDQLERLLAGMDLVSREEFEATKAMAAKAREEQELLLRRIEALEAPRAAPRRTARRRAGSPTS
jgi:BMFP domain-containing protein YqiC